MSLGDLWLVSEYLAIAATANPRDLALVLRAHDARVAYERALSKEGK